MKISTLNLSLLKSRNLFSKSGAVQPVKTVITKRFTEKIFAFWTKFIMQPATWTTQSTSIPSLSGAQSLRTGGAYRGT